MQHNVLDSAAWGSAWRHRQVGEKVALSLGLVLTALATPAWPGSLLVALVSTAAMARAGVPVRTLLLVLAAPLGFILLGAVSVALVVGAAPGGAWWQWGPVSVGASSVRRAGEVSGHALAGALAVMVLATTTPMTDLLSFARRHGVPAPLVEVAALTYRLLWVLLSCALTIREAQRARLVDDAALRRRLAATGDAAGAVLVRSWDRARRLEDGLAGRGRDGGLATLDRPVPASAAFRLATATSLLAVWLLCWATR